MKEVEFETDDGVKLRADYYAEKGGDSVVIIAPGWCMTKNSRSFREIADTFAQEFDVLSIDFRGHGKSGGFYTFGAKETKDMDAAVEFCSKYKNIFLTGYSLGAMTALNCASYNPRITKVIAVSPPCDFSKIENQMYKKEAWLETFKKFELKRFLSIRPSIIPHKKIKPIDIADKISSPVLFIAGKKDPTVHFWHTQELFNKAKCTKHLELFEDGIHAEDIFLYHKEEFTKLCMDWLFIV